MYSRYEGKAWEERFLPRLTAREVEQLPKENALAVLAIGAVEQHGPHLPIYTDTLIAEVLLAEAFEQLPEDAQIWLLPTIPYGKSNEHIGHSGVLTLSAGTLQSIVLDIARSLEASGFRRLLLFTTHGGNYDLLNMMAREVRIATGQMVFRLNGSSLDIGEGIISDHEQRVGIHAGDYETSLVMAMKENWVHADQLVCEIPDLKDAPKWGSFAWVMNDISVSGVAGDATLATQEKGERILKHSSISLAEYLRQMAVFEMDDRLKGKVK